MGLLNNMFGTTQQEDILLMVYLGKVFSWNGQKVREIGGGGCAHTVREHENELYEGGIAGVNKLVSNRDTSKIIWIRDRENLSSLCSHYKILYDASNGPPFEGNYEIHETLSNKLISTRENQIKALVSHNNKLYDGGLYGIYETLADIKISDRPCETLCSFNGILYNGGENGVFNTLSEEKIASTKYPICSLCSYNSKLIDAGLHSFVRDTLSGKPVLYYNKFRSALRSTVSTPVTLCDMTAVKPEVLKNALKI